MKRFALGLLAAAALVVMSGAVQASPLDPTAGAPSSTTLHTGGADPNGMGVQFSGFTNDFTNGQWSLGWQFTVGSSNLNVTALGMFDDSLGGGPGWTSSHDVGIYNAVGSLLASATVTSSDAAQNFFRFAQIATLTLQAGQTYYIAGTTGSDNYTWNPNGTVFNSDITFNGSAYVPSSTLAFPSGGPDGNVGYFGPNFLTGLSSTPEPGSLTLLGLCSLGVAGYNWRRRKQAVTA